MTNQTTNNQSVITCLSNVLDWFKVKKEEAEELAHEYDFSDGQIENISRKKKIQSIIECCDPDFATLKQYCGEEQLNSEQKRRRIGF